MPRYIAIDQQNVGKRVELHPSTDQWMRGDRYGEIVRTTIATANRLDPRDSAIVYVTIRLDRSGRTLRFHESHILRILDQWTCPRCGKHEIGSECTYCLTLD